MAASGMATHASGAIVTPKTNADYWRAKIEGNIERFAGQLEELAQKGWEGLILWECELSEESNLRARLIKFLSEHSDQKPPVRVTHA